MKKIVFLAIFATLVAAIGTGTNSCAPTSPLVPDTTKLVSAPSSATITWVGTSKVDSVAGFSVGLTCGCPFAYTVVSYGDDTSVIHFNVGDGPDSLTTHTVTANIYPSQLPAGPDTVSAWVVLMTWHDRTSSSTGIQLFDTIRVTAIY